jgi:hypothetical protein
MVSLPTDRPPLAPAESAKRPRLRLVGPVLLTVSFALIATAALLGPSATEAPLGPSDDGATPPWHLTARPGAGMVTLLLGAAVVTGVAAIALALSGRWRPRPARLVVAGSLAVATLGLLAPIGSADPLSYAAYGRMVVTGHDPWTTAPAQLPGDPVERAVEVPWQHTPSVYGPVATGEQAAASWLAGDDVAGTVLVLDVVGAVVFIASGLLLQRLSRDEVTRRRAALLWSANPLLWLEVVAGGHLDVLVAGLVLAAVAVAPRSRFAAGALTGAAAAVKAPAGLVWVAFVWAARRSRQAVIALTAGAVLVAGVTYALAGSAAFRQLGRASHLVSLATPWRPVADLMDPAFGHGASRQVIRVLALVMFALVVVALHRINPEVRSGAPVPLAFALSFGYVLCAPYALPWYDALPWVLLPLLAASWLDVLLLAHTTVLTVAYLPGRAAFRLHGWTHAVAFGMRDVVAPILLTGLLFGVAVVSVRRGQALPSRAEGA